MITSPYNFVPLNEEVFYPSWSNNGNIISHDIPFEDGESGVIDITITAKSPIFIRNNSKDREKQTSEFCHHVNSDGAKEYYIPGSSIKGMIRNTLEIISFSKINVDEKKLAKPLSIRDMTPNNPKFPSYNHPVVATAKKCGFLVQDGDGFKILDCGKTLGISYTEIKKATNKSIKHLQYAKDKYNQIGHIDLAYKKDKKIMDVRGKKIPKDIAIYDSLSNKKASLIFTGDIGNKKNEFIFQENGREISIDKDIVKDFKNVYFHNEDSIDGQYFKTVWGKEIKKIPIFYVEDNQNIIAIGLTQIFKLAYKKTLLEASKQNSDNTSIDLAETIFGTVKDKYALKGRVQFSHLVCDTISFTSKEVEQVLGSPNPTYYPNYIRQTDIKGNGVNKYITLMDKDAQISGWKRYPIQSSIQNYLLPKNEDGKVNHDVATKFKPLDAGTIFHGKIRFHNLKKLEIGALLSALTFHGNSSTNLHNIGMAKGHGYGKITVEPLLHSLNFTQEEYLQSFEKEISLKIPTWKSSPQLKELLAMSSTTTKSSMSLRYQQLENERGGNDFTSAKKAKDFLQAHSGNIVVTKVKERVKNKPVTLNDKIVKSQTAYQQPLSSNGVSKTKIKKAIISYWTKNFGIFYHQNQVKEFFSSEGFITTPQEQIAVYDKHKNDENFVRLIKQVHDFNNDMLDEDAKSLLYAQLTKGF